MPGIPRGALFGLLSLQNDYAMYAFTALVFVASYAAIARIVNSPFGVVLTAVQQNEGRAMSLGYDIYLQKLVAFILSAAFCGLGGAMKAVAFQFATLSDVGFQASGLPVLMSLIGGIGTLPGPVVGAGVIILIENYLAPLGEWVHFIEGAIFVGAVLVMRRGIVGQITNWRMMHREKKTGAQPSAAPVANS
jgi:branched-chain amino acid transport system permease protein